VGGYAPRARNRLCARGAWWALLGGPSTSPLGDAVVAMPTSSSDAHERLWPSIMCGTVAGLCGGLLATLLDSSQHVWGIAAIYGISSFVAASIAVRFAPSNLLEVWGLVTVGIAVGVFLGVLVHPAINGGERNLWPFEVVLFAGCGMPAIWLGMWASRWVQRHGLRRVS